jgi:uncharacterized OB-fold protein
MNTPQHWRLKDQRLRLQGAQCPRCGWKSFPPRQYCPHCVGAQQASEALDEYTLGIVVESIPDSVSHASGFHPVNQ